MEFTITRDGEDITVEIEYDFDHFVPQVMGMIARIDGTEVVFTADEREDAYAAIHEYEAGY